MSQSVYLHRRLPKKKKSADRAQAPVRSEHLFTDGHNFEDVGVVLAGLYILDRRV